MKRRTPAKKSSPKINVAPRILSSEEKRQLILAHSAMRRPMDPVQRMSLWAGVIVCMLFVFGAWAYTVGSGIQKSIASPLDQELQDVVDNTKQFTEDSTGDLGDLGEQFKNVTDRLNALAEEQAVLDNMIQQLSATSTSATTTTSRNDLFKPGAPAKTTTSTSPTTP